MYSNTSLHRQDSIQICNDRTQFKSATTGLNSNLQRQDSTQICNDRTQFKSATTGLNSNLQPLNTSRATTPTTPTTQGLVVRCGCLVFMWVPCVYCLFMWVPCVYCLTFSLELMVHLSMLSLPLRSVFLRASVCVCATWLIHMWHMTHSYVTCVCVCDVTHSYVWDISAAVESLMLVWNLNTQWKS